MKTFRIKEWEDYCIDNNITESVLNGIGVNDNIIIITERYGNIRISKISQEDDNVFEWESHASLVAFDQYDVVYERSCTAKSFLYSLWKYLSMHDLVRDLEYTKLKNGFVFENMFYSDGPDLLAGMLNSETLNS